MRVGSIAVRVALCCVFGCGGEESAPADAVTALFEVPRAGQPPPSGFYGLPFPTNLRLRDDGTVDLEDYVRPNALIGGYLEQFDRTHRGFGVTGPTFFRFGGAIDSASLPADPEASQQADASVYLVNVQSGSPRYGERIPVRFRFESAAGETIGPNWLAVLPYPGFVMQQEATHAVVVTERVIASDGSAIRRGSDFEAIISSELPSDPDLARAQQLHQPLLDWLDEPGGEDRDQVISATVFTTLDCDGLMAGLREVIWSMPAPVPTAITWREDTADYALYVGAYEAPNFQDGDAPYLRSGDGGAILLDADSGLPVVHHMEPMRFSMTAPLGTMPEQGWPVVIYQHGTGGDYLTVHRSGVARALARQGIATISTDQVLHSPRTEGVDPQIAFFNFQNPLAARDSPRQGAADGFSLLRLATSVDYSGEQRTFRFDTDRIFFQGHSQGGVTGPPMVALEPMIKGAVFSGTGSLLTLSLLHKTAPTDIRALVELLIRDYPLDEFNPVLALLQMWFDATDTACYANLLVREPPDGFEPKDLFVAEGLTDTFTPNPSIKAFATAVGLSQVGPILEPIEGLELRGVGTLEAPVTGNLNGHTAVLTQYNQATGSDGHFVLFDVPAAHLQFAEFFGTLARTGQATLVEP